jgi:hypothetical protein
MALSRFLLVVLLLALLGDLAYSVNPASDGGFYIVPTPTYSGDVLISDFNSGSGPRDVLLFFDSVTPTYYNTDYVYVTNVTDGLSLVSGMGPSIITLNANIQYGTDADSAFVNLIVDGLTFAGVSLLNSGPMSNYSLDQQIRVTLFPGATIEIGLQYNGTDSPQFGNFSITVVADPTPIYSGEVQVATFNAGSGPRNQFLYFDSTNATIYNTNYVLITNTTEGLVMVADIGPVMVYIQATVQFGVTWSNDESSPVLVNLIVNGFSAGITPMTNSGSSSNYSVYKYFNYALYSYNTVGINLQYNSNDAPQFSNFFLSIIPMSYTLRR